jgi:sec-independent protein translocase protein TatC
MIKNERLMSIWEHLKELRNRLFKAVLALAVGTGVSFMFADRLIHWLTLPIGSQYKLQSIEVTENFSVFMQVSLLSGFIIAIPVILYQLLAFIFPGLTSKERRWIRVGIPLATIFYASGALFTYYVMMPTAIPFLLGFMDIPTNPRLSNYLNFVTSLIFWVGLAFESPLVVFLLAKLRLVTAGMLARQWRIAVVVIAVMAALITPTGDPVNMGILMAPLIVIYLVSILFALIARPRKQVL